MQEQPSDDELRQQIAHQQKMIEKHGKIAAQYQGRDKASRDLCSDHLGIARRAAKKKAELEKELKRVGG